MATMKNLIIWVKCPKYTSHRSIEYCWKCDYYAGNVSDTLQCIYEDK